MKVIFGILCSVFFAQITPAQEADNAQINKWTVQCPKQAEGRPTQCFAMSTLRSPQNKNLFATIAFSKPLANKLPAMQITTPLGTILNQGIMIQLGKTKANKVPYKFCIAAGCITTFNVADDIMKAFVDSEKLSLQFTLMENRTANVTLDLEGFSDIYSIMLIEQEKLNKEFAQSEIK